jgi:hypothetical protein
MSPDTRSSISKRRRIVEGSCWPCKQRRVKCDLEKPSCRRCVASNSEDCSYGKVLVRWKQSPAKGVLAIQPGISDGLSLAVSERRAIDYFKNRLWPLFSTVHEPCPPPVALALRSRPVLQALCVFAEEHRDLQRTKDRFSSKEVFEQRRLQCLTVVRSHLSNNDATMTTFPALLVAVLLLYFLEGYVNCTQDDASTQCHLAGALAIIDALGGFEAAWSASDRMTRMLLSELASTDLTDSMLQDRKPSFPASIWSKMDTGSVWWESLPGTKPLAAILETMAEMCFYRCGLLDGKELETGMLLDFERSLQPVYSMLEYCSNDVTRADFEHDTHSPAAVASLSLNRSFQHTGLIYLYHALRKIPTEHFLVQQHVHACLGCVQSMGTSPRTRNCTLFPLYVAGAHAVTAHHKDWVLEALNAIHANLGFESVLSIQATLQQKWRSSHGTATWSELFKDTAICTLVI